LVIGSVVMVAVPFEPNRLNLRLPFPEPGA